MSELPPFSGENPYCIKCDYGEADFFYCPGALRIGPDGFIPDAGSMRRMCMRCGYTWFEQCADVNLEAP